MPTDYRMVLETVFKQTPFSIYQIKWIKRWWLKIDQTTLDQLNFLLLNKNKIQASKDINGELYISSAFLTDSLQGKRLEYINNILMNLILVYNPNIIEKDIYI